MTATPTCSDALDHAASGLGQPADGFESVYRAHHRAVFLFLCRRTGDRHAAEDIAAEVFLTGMRKWRRAQHGPAPVRAWLYRIASYKAGHWQRANRRRLAREIAAGQGERVASGTDGEIDQIQSALLALSARHQHVLSLFYFADMTIDQIAQVDRCAAGTVKSRMARAREAMRAELQKKECQP